MNTTKLDTATVLKSLADNTRLEIVRKLVRDGCETAGSEIVDSCAKVFQLSQPAMSHHFGKLVASGVLSERKVGVEKYYQLNTELLRGLGIDAERL